MQPPVLTGYEAGWVSEAVWTLSSRENPLFHTRNPTSPVQYIAYRFQKNDSFTVFFAALIYSSQGYQKKNCYGDLSLFPNFPCAHLGSDPTYSQLIHLHTLHLFLCLYMDPLCNTECRPMPSNGYEHKRAWPNLGSYPGICL